MPAAGPRADRPPRTLVAIATTGGPSVIRGFAFDDIAAAHERMEANLNVGKIVLDL